MLNKIKNKMSGFTLIEIMLVLGLVGLMTVSYMQYAKKSLEDQVAVQNGKQLGQIVNAVNQYILLNYTKIFNKTDPNCTGYTIPTPASPAPDPCYITTSTLISAGILPQSTTSAYLTSWGADYRISIYKNAIGSLQALIASTTPWREGGNIATSLLGRAVAEVGPDGGVINTANKVDGYKGNWSETASDTKNDKATEVGTLAARAGYGSSLFEEFVRRDGSVKMIGDLDLNGHKLNGVTDINATGDITTTGNLVATNIEAKGTLKANSMDIGNLTASGLTVNGDATVTGTLNTKSINNSDTITTRALNTTDLTMTGDLTTGNITSSGNITAAGNISGATGSFSGSLGAASMNAELMSTVDFTAEGNADIGGDLAVTGTTTTGHLINNGTFNTPNDCFDVITGVTPTSYEDANHVMQTAINYDKTRLCVPRLAGATAYTVPPVGSQSAYTATSLAPDVIAPYVTATTIFNLNMTDQIAKIFNAGGLFYRRSLEAFGRAANYNNGKYKDTGGMDTATNLPVTSIWGRNSINARVTCGTSGYTLGSWRDPSNHVYVTTYNYPKEIPGSPIYTGSGSATPGIYSDITIRYSKPSRQRLWSCRTVAASGCDATDYYCRMGGFVPGTTTPQTGSTMTGTTCDDEVCLETWLDTHPGYSDPTDPGYCQMWEPEFTGNDTYIVLQPLPAYIEALPTATESDSNPVYMYYISYARYEYKPATGYNTAAFPVGTWASYIDRTKRILFRQNAAWLWDSDCGGGAACTFCAVPYDTN